MKSHSTIKDQNDLVQHGIAAAKAGKKEIAETKLSRAVEQDPTNEIAWLWLAYISDDVDRTISFLRRVLALNTENAQARNSLTKALLQRGIAYAKSGENLLARESLSEAATNNPKDEAAWLWLASVAENTVKMATHLQKVLDLNPNNQRALTWLQSIGKQAVNKEPIDHSEAGMDLKNEEKPPTAVELDPVDLSLSQELKLDILSEESTLRPAEIVPDPADLNPAENVSAKENEVRPVVNELERVSDAESMTDEQEKPAPPPDFEMRLALMRAEVYEMETRWRRESEARLIAEQHAGELQEDLFQSMNLRREAERLNLKTDVAIRDCELAKADVRKLEDELHSITELWNREKAAREAAELRIQEIESETERVIKENIAAIRENDLDHKNARDEALAKAREAEAWVQELSGKWQEEIAAREAAEKHVAELEAELGRTEKLLQEAELAWTKLEVRPQASAGYESPSNKSLDNANRRIVDLETRLAETEKRLEFESHNRVKAEMRLRQSADERDSLSLSNTSRSEIARRQGDQFISGSIGRNAEFSANLPDVLRFSDADGSIDQRDSGFDPKSATKVALFILVVSGSLLTLLYITYVLLRNF